MSDIRAYIITEGKSDQLVLERLLDNLAGDVYIHAASGASSAHSLASSVLASRSKPVALVLDADTKDAQALREKKSDLAGMLRMVRRSAPFEIFFFQPNLEGFLWEARDELSQLIDDSIDFQLPLEERSDFIEALTGPSKPQLIQELVQRMSDETVESLRRMSPIVELREFLRNARNNPQTRSAVPGGG